VARWQGGSYFRGKGDQGGWRRTGSTAHTQEPLEGGPTLPSEATLDGDEDDRAGHSQVALAFAGNADRMAATRMSMVAHKGGTGPAVTRTRV
jgi:hypothetical protein